MISSRDLSDLHPIVKDKAEKFVSACKTVGEDILIYCTYRDNEAQDALYAHGRTVGGAIITNAKGGQSFHNYHLAFDWVPLIHGKPTWNDKERYEKCAIIAESFGLQWAGRWEGSLHEEAHCQYSNGLTIHDLQNGATI